MELSNYAVRTIVMRWLIWNDIYGRENNEKMKRKMIKYFIKEGLDRPVEKFKVLHRCTLSMGTSIWTALDVYIGDNSNNSIQKILDRVCAIVQQKYPNRLKHLHQEYLNNRAKVENK